MNNVKYCYICSPARSGSTFFDLLLGGHSQISSLGEFSFLGKNLALGEKCSCGALVSECSAWNSVYAHIKLKTGVNLKDCPYGLKQWDTLSSVVNDHAQQTKLYLLFRKFRSAWMDFRFMLPPPLQKHVPVPPTLKSGTKNTFLLYDAVLDAWEKKLVVDSSKNVHKALSLYSARPQSFRILFLTRDGRGVYHSRHSSGFSREESINGWKNYNQRALLLLGRNVHSDHLMQVRYEDLSINPKAVLNRVCDFLEIPFEEAMTEFSLGERHAINGNDTRFSRNRGVRLDERWKNELAPSELAYFHRHCKGLNRRLGYD